MSANIFGERFKVISFGESHGPAYGVVIEGMPAGVEVDLSLLNHNLDRRKPGQSPYVTARKETDQPEILSGIFESKTLGTPIAIIVRNENQKSQDYHEIKSEPRIGHADDVWKNKFGHSDHRGGGRSSGRETLNRVIAGSFAQMLFKHLNLNIQVSAFAIEIGEHKILKRSADLPENIKKMLEEAKVQGESYGGVVECVIENAPAHLGQPVFHKFKSDLASAVLSIGAVTGFEFGAGFESSSIKGTEFHQRMVSASYGGIRGGITTGEEIGFRVAFKPTSSIKDVAKKGRHDPCIIPRALPVVEAMVWLVLADHYLWSKTDRV